MEDIPLKKRRVFETHATSVAQMPLSLWVDLIFKFLDCFDCLALMKTCKTFYHYKPLRRRKRLNMQWYTHDYKYHLWQYRILSLKVIVPRDVYCVRFCALNSVAVRPSKRRLLRLMFEHLFRDNCTSVIKAYGNYIEIMNRDNPMEYYNITFKDILCLRCKYITIQKVFERLHISVKVRSIGQIDWSFIDNNMFIF